jgi:hypothetical protein
MVGLSEKYQASIRRWTEHIIDESQDLIEDVVYEETGEKIEDVLHDLYSDAALDEIYSDIEDLDSIEDREFNDVICIIEEVISKNYGKIKEMIKSAKK